MRASASIIMMILLFIRRENSPKRGSPRLTVSRSLMRTKNGNKPEGGEENKMTDKEKLIYQHVLAIREILKTNPQWSGYLNIAIMDKTGSIMIHNRFYDQDKDDPINLYVPSELEAEK